MKLITIVLIGILATIARAHGQDSTALCPFLKTPQFNVFIPGSHDSIQSNGMKVRVIEFDSLVNGFELVSDDSMVKVKGFFLVFDDNTKTLALYSKSTGTSRMTDDRPDIVPLSKLGDARYLVLDRIMLEYNGFCYTISGQVYFDQ
jgi:hypothetical protein